MKNIEQQYLDLCQEVLDKGVLKDSRVGKSLSLFSRELRHSFMKTGCFPLYTTKKVSLKNVFTELKWMLLGRSDLRWLLEHDCNIWVGDCHKKFNQSVPQLEALTKEDFIQYILNDNIFSMSWGDMGEIYGRQMRSEKYDIEGILVDNIHGYKDQIDSIIKLLKTEPDSRRMVCSMWNVNDLDDMLLQPCHYSFQVYTRTLSKLEKDNWLTDNTVALDCYPLSLTIDDKLYEELYEKFNVPERAISLKFNMRSNDLPLGNPYNIASYGMLLLMLAKQVNMVADELICSIGDVHIYENQIEGIKEQLKRKPLYLPELTLSERNVKDISEYDYEDFTLIDYMHYPTIKIPLSN